MNIQNKIGRGYLPELFQQIRTYLQELFRQMRTYLQELFQQIRTYLPELFWQIRTYLPDLFRQIRGAIKKKMSQKVEKVHNFLDTPSYQKVRILNCGLFYLRR